ncbi:MAG: protein phosphatase 2C domain-containing protein [Candidatus Sericytochromatia bacterium]|nr:protein phosphatase 2C domain-containing protein [Candidatus Sericytochromatia bacterium]
MTKEFYQEKPPSPATGCTSEADPESKSEPISQQLEALPVTDSLPEPESVTFAEVREAQPEDATQPEPEREPEREKESEPETVNLSKVTLNSLRTPQGLRLPNARVGSAYQIQLAPESLNRTRPAPLHLMAPPPPGLQWLSAEQELKGIPELAGEYQLTLQGPSAHAESPEPAIPALLLTINPDPRSLWQNLPSDTEQRYWKTDTDLKRLESTSVPGLKLLAASRRGRSHAHAGTCRDDDFLLQELPGNWFLLGVADGAGSARYSRQGSRLACQVAAQVIEAKLSDPAFVQSLESQLADFANSGQALPPHGLQARFYDCLAQAALSARKAIEAEAQKWQDVEPEIQAKDFATTLQLCLVYPLAEQWFFAAFSIGDGMIAVAQSDAIHLLAEPDSGEYSGQTRFLTMGSVWQDASAIFGRLKFALLTHFSHCLLMTDGICDPYFASENAMQKFENWQGLLSEMDQCLHSPQPDEALLEWLNFWSEGEHDDRTLALLTGGTR